MVQAAESGAGAHTTQVMGRVFSRSIPGRFLLQAEMGPVLVVMGQEGLQ